MRLRLIEVCHWVPKTFSLRTRFFGASLGNSGRSFQPKNRGLVFPEDFFEILYNISSSLRKVFKTTNKVTFAVSGTGSSGMEMGMNNLVESSDEVLILKNGEFGDRMENLALRLGAKVSTMSVPWGHSFNQDKVIEKIKSMPNLKVICVVQAETSTGVLQEIDLIGKYVKD